MKYAHRPVWQFKGNGSLGYAEHATRKSNCLVVSEKSCSGLKTLFWTAALPRILLLSNTSIDNYNLSIPFEMENLLLLRRASATAIKISKVDLHAANLKSNQDQTTLNAHEAHSPLLTSSSTFLICAAHGYTHCHLGRVMLALTPTDKSEMLL